ncbi:MAG: YihY/virulence factor BrkB family protein [Chloroflexi bacterium]|nr:YihY/virulence factor BrkB family protein [Chloroflexota bacterium]
MNPWFENQVQRVSYFVKTTETRAQAMPFIGALALAWRAYRADQCATLAAALAYYALLSIFPLALFVLTMASLFLDSDQAMRAVTGLISGYVPAGAQMIRATLQEVIRLRGALTVAAIAGFVWSAAGVFDLMQLGIHRAFKMEHTQPAWRRRVQSLAMVIGAGGLFGLSFVTTAAIRMSVHYGVLQRRDILPQVLPVLGALILGFLVFVVLYRFVPGRRASWRTVWFGALIAAILWEIAKLGFAWYITNFALLNLVYGSVGAIIALMLWGYISAAILLYGAEIAAVRSRAGLPDD